MSITSAFAFGFDRAYCAEGCAATRLSPYFDSNSRQPYNELKLRPAMSIAATTVENARAHLVSDHKTASAERRGVSLTATRANRTAAPGSRTSMATLVQF